MRLQQEDHKRGIRAAYLVNQELELAPRATQQWQIVANVEQSQAARGGPAPATGRPGRVSQAIALSIEQG